MSLRHSLLMRPNRSPSLQHKKSSNTIKQEIDNAISDHIRAKIHGYLKWFGFRNSPIPVIIIVFGVLSVNLLTNALTLQKSEYCLYLNICVFLFQAESVVLYGFAFFSVTKGFIENVVNQLAQIDICSPEYTQIVQQYAQSNDSNDTDDEIHDSELIISSLKFNNPHIPHKQASVKVYKAYKSITKQSGTTLLFNEALKCILVCDRSIYIYQFSHKSSNICNLYFSHNSS